MWPPLPSPHTPMKGVGPLCTGLRVGPTPLYRGCWWGRALMMLLQRFNDSPFVLFRAQPQWSIGCGAAVRCGGGGHH